MANPLKSLPAEAIANIRAFASDRYVPHPFAEAIRALIFNHYYDSQLMFVIGEIHLFRENLSRDPPDCDVSTLMLMFNLAEYEEPDMFVEKSNWRSGISLGCVRSDDE